MQNDLLHEHTTGFQDSPLTIYDGPLAEVISAAASEFYCQLEQATPFMAPEVGRWINSLYRSLPLADVFQQPAAFPMLLLPWTLEQTIRGTPDIVFQSDIALSTINGYHYIRFIDNIMDGDTPPPLELLPILSFFYFQAHTPYQRHFPHDHFFWQTYRTCWLRCADVTARDASLEAIDGNLFMEVAAQKTSAAKIPLAAVCWHYDRADLFEQWSHFHDALGCWHQMTNDLRDWQSDLSHANTTYLLSEAARRKEPGESVAEWIVREGYAWAVGVLGMWMAEMKAQASQLGSPALLEYLDVRERLQNERHAAFLGVLSPLAELISGLKGRAVE